MFSHDFLESRGSRNTGPHLLDKGKELQQRDTLLFESKFSSLSVIISIYFYDGLYVYNKSKGLIVFKSSQEFLNHDKMYLHHFTV